MTRMRRVADEQVALNAVRGAGFAQILGYVANAVTGAHMIADPLPHPAGATTLKLHGYSQLDNYSCGAVAGWCVLRFFHPRRSFQRFYTLCRVTPSQGVTLANLTQALRVSGVGVQYRRRLTFERLQTWIDSGCPVICLVQHDLKDPATHWLVVYGYRKQPTKAVFVAGNGWLHVAGGFSVEGQHRIAWGDFRRMFAGHALVCCRP